MNEKRFDVSRRIICRHQSDTTSTSTENGRQKIIEAAAVRKDEVLNRLNLIESNFVYHRKNVCYKSTLCVKLLNPSRNQMIQKIKKFNVVIKVRNCKKLRCVYC